MAATVQVLPVPAVVVPTVHGIAWQFQDVVGSIGDENARRGILEACKLFKTTLKSPSLDEQLPNGGTSLLQPTSSYYSGIQKLGGALDSHDEGTDVFERRARAHKRKEVKGIIT